MHPWTWTPAKNDKTFAERGFDFEFATLIFEGRVVLRRSDRDGEARIQAIGVIDGRYYSVIYTKRSRPRRRHIISARRARKNEEAYYNR